LREPPITFLSVSGLKNNESEDNDGEKSIWIKIIARLCLGGRSPEQVRKLTLRQGKAILEEMNKEFKAHARIMGAEVEEENEPREATSSDIAFLMSSFGR